ncbi:MAG: GspH/FimT family pseudopilin [Pseudomonadota bacterium]|nr:MAG: GspH/FimT family pseudopilin [Pseudomonadota bacterium]
MNKHVAGLTIVELMIAMAVIAVVVSLGVPHLPGVVGNNRLTAQVNTLSNHLAYARSEAVKSGTPVTVTSNNGAIWQDGWTVWVDTNNSGLMDAGEELRIGEAFGAASVLTPDNGTDFITYNGTGALAGNPVTFTLCNTSSPYGKQLKITGSGRGRLADSKYKCP